MSPSTTKEPFANAATPGKESRGKAWGFTGLLVLLYVINWGDKAVLGIVAQPLADEIGLSASQIGLAGSAFFLAYTLGGLFAGLLHRSMTLKWLMVLLSLAWAVAMLPIVFAATFAALLASRILLGLFEGPAYSLVNTGVFSWHPSHKRGLPATCITSAASISKIAVAPALALVVAAWGWRPAFLMLAAASVVWCLVWLPTWQEGPYGKLAAEQAASRNDEGGDPKSTVQQVSWMRIFRTPTFLGGLTAVFGMYGLIAVVMTWLPSYFEVGLGYSRVQAGLMFGFPSIASIIAMVFTSSLSDRLLSRGATFRALRGILPAACLLIGGLFLVMLPYVGVSWLAVAVVSIGYGIGAVVLPQFNAAISEIVPPRQLAGTLGVFLAVSSAGGVVGPYVTGIVVDAAASPAAGYASAFQLFGVVAVIGAVLALLTVNPERDKARLMGAPTVSAAESK